MTPTQFFYKHAGWSYDPKIETKTQGRWKCAHALAEAEAWAADVLTFEWKEDDDVDWSGHDWCGRCDNHTALGCVACWAATGEVAADLWEILDPDANYRRVIEAELACEVMAIVEKSLEAV